MYCNIMETYIEFTRKNIMDYLKIILGTSFNKKIATDFTKAYIDGRYYGYNIEEKRNLSGKSLMEYLAVENEKLKEKFPKKENIVFETYELFKYFLYIDGVKNGKEFDEIVSLISKRRTDRYKIPQTEEKEFEKQFLKRIKSDELRRRDFLNKFKTEEFELIIKKITYSEKVFNVSIKSNVKFKEIFKEEAIERVFNKRTYSRRKINSRV